MGMACFHHTKPSQQNYILSCPLQAGVYENYLTTCSQAERRTRSNGLTKKEFKKKNATMLYLYGLHKMKKVEDTKDSIKAIIGDLNVVSFYF